MAVEASVQVINTTMNNYLREEENSCMRDRKILELIKQRGRNTYKASGTQLDWKVRYKRASLAGYADGDTLSFARKDRRKTANLQYRGYAMTDSIGKMQRLQNSGIEAIISLWDEMGKNLIEDLTDAFGDEMYINGNAAANYKRFHGIESLFNGATSTSNASKVGVMPSSASYAGLVMQLGYYGGAASSGSVWPVGTFDATYDFWHPLVVDYTNTAWPDTTKTFANTCVEALRFGILFSMKNKSTRKGRLDLVVLDRELYRQFLDKYDPKERIMVMRGKESGDEQTVGFGDTINMDGAEISTEYGIPPAVGYGFNADQIELLSMQEQLFVADGPDWDQKDRAWLMACDVLGNLRYESPRYFTKWMALGGS